MVRERGQGGGGGGGDALCPNTRPPGYLPQPCRSLGPLRNHAHSRLAGNANPRFVRMTMYNLPTSDEIARQTAVPMGAVIQPMASLSPTEAPVELVAIEGGPVRCDRCKAYMNPFMQFVDGGRQFVCNLCRHINVGACSMANPASDSTSPHPRRAAPALPTMLTRALSARRQPHAPPQLQSVPTTFATWTARAGAQTCPSGPSCGSARLTLLHRRSAAWRRPSVMATHAHRDRRPCARSALQTGRPQEFSDRPPQPAAYVFAIDVSFACSSSGVLAEICRAIRESLDDFPREYNLTKSPVRVGFITYDRTLHFYNLNVGRPRALAHASRDGGLVARSPPPPPSVADPWLLLRPPHSPRPPPPSRTHARSRACRHRK